MVTSLTALHLSYKAREIFTIFAIVLKLLQPVLFQVSDFSGQPDVKSLLLDGSEDFVVIACDGLWDVIPPWEVNIFLIVKECFMCLFYH